MNKLLSSITGLILIISLAVGASAAVDVTYNYNQNNVNVEAYNCADSLCKQIKTFGGTLTNTQITQGKTTVSYPTQLQDFGYAVFHFSKGFLPKETRTDFRGTGALTEDVTFSKVKVCRSVIDTFTVTNDAKANVPLSINVAASLDANTNSAFTFVQNTIEFVPQDKINDYYSTDIKARLTITSSSGATVNQQTQEFTTANGNPIKADESRKIEFTWTPSQDGQYKITVETEVVDDQCETSEKQSTTKDISVLQGMPRNQCYAILNGLKTQTDVVRINEDMQTEFTKLSNHANDFASTDANYQLTPTQTQVQYLVTGPSGETVYSQTTTLNTNLTTTPTKQTFSWKPTKTGDHTITVTGTAVGSQCNGLNNVADTIALKLFVSEKPKYELKIVLVDSQTGNKVENAKVKLTWDNNENVQFSNAKGESIFSQLESRTYNYEVAHKDFQTLTGTVALTNSDQTLTLSLQRATATPQNKFKVEFKVVDQADNTPINGAKVKLNGYVGNTGSNGMIQFVDVANAEYNFEVSHSEFETGKGKITVNNADMTVLVKLRRTKTAISQVQRATHKIFIDSIRMPNAYEVSPGDQLEITVNLENSGTKSLEDVKVTATIQELGARSSVGPLNKLSVGDSTTRKLLLTIPEDAEKGSYYVRIAINNKENAESQRIVHREIEII